VIPGVFTPTEIMDALSSGAEMVKLFPAGALVRGICAICAVRFRISE